MRYEKTRGLQALAFMEKLDFVREAGTEAEERAALKLAEEIRSMGGCAEIETFPFRTRVVGETRLEVRQPYQKTYPVLGIAGAGSTPASGIEGPLFYAEDGDPISLRQAEGRIVLVNPPLTGELYRRICESSALACLTTTGSPIDEGPDRSAGRRELRRGEPDIAGATLHIRDAMEMVEREADQVWLQLDQAEEERMTRNVAALIEGCEHPDQIIALTAHYDSVPEGHGAYDNLASVAVMLELYRYFLVRPPRRSLLFLWCGGEEKGLKGSKAYLDAHRDLRERCLVNLNSDLAGQAMGGDVFGVMGEEEVEKWILDFCGGLQMGARVKRQVWSSDSNSFSVYGIPSVTFDRDGFGMHTRHDSLELISARELAREIYLLGNMTEELANAPAFPFSRRVPENIVRELKEYFSES